MESLSQLNASLERLSSMKPEEAFFHQDFVRVLGALRFPYLYDGEGTPVPQSALDLIILISADIICRMPEGKDIPSFNTELGVDLKECLLGSLAVARINEQNVHDFVRIISKMSIFSEPRFPERELGSCGKVDEDWMYGPVSDYSGILRRLQSFRARGLCGQIARVVCSGDGYSPAKMHLFSVCVHQMESGAEIEQPSISGLIKFAERWLRNGNVPALERHGLKGGLRALEAKNRELDRARQELISKLRRDTRVSAQIIGLSAYLAVRRLQREREIKDINLRHPGRLRQCGGRY